MNPCTTLNHPQHSTRKRLLDIVGRQPNLIVATSGRKETDGVAVTIKLKFSPLLYKSSMSAHHFICPHIRSCETPYCSSCLGLNCNASGHYCFQQWTVR